MSKRQPEMTDDQVRERLKEMGVDPNQWSEMGGGDPQHPAFVLRMATHASKLKQHMEQQVGVKQAEIRLLQEKLIRLKFGGGN